MTVTSEAARVEPEELEQVLDDEMTGFLRVLGGPILFQAMSAGVELDLFTELDERPDQSRTELAQRLGIAEDSLRILLLACASAGLVYKTAQGYRNRPIATRMLSRRSPASFTNVVRWQNHINYRPMARFHDALLAGTNVGLEEIPGSGTTLYARLAQNPALEAIFQGAMQQISVQANDSLGDYLAWREIHHVLDVGGGNGENLIRLLTRYPHLNGTVFDTSSVCAHARRRIAENGLSTRLDTVEGDCFTSLFPACDAVLFCHFFTIWSSQENQALLQKAYRCLPSGGRAIIFNMMQNDAEDGPLTAAIGSPYFLTLASGRGMLYTWSEYTDWMYAAGFSQVELLRLPMDHGVVCGIKA